MVHLIDIAEESGGAALGHERRELHRPNVLVLVIVGVHGVHERPRPRLHLARGAPRAAPERGHLHAAHLFFCHTHF